MKITPLDSNGDPIEYATAFFEITDGAGFFDSGICAFESLAVPVHYHCSYSPSKGEKGPLWMTMLLIHESCLEVESVAECLADASKRVVTDPPQHFVNDDPTDLPASMKIIIEKKGGPK